MDVLKYINIPELTTTVAIVFVVVAGIHFMKMSEPEKLLESGRMKTFRILINEIILFTIITIVLTFVHDVGTANSVFISINFVLILFTLTLGYSYSDFRNKKLQLLVNKVFIHCFGQKYYKFFVFGLILAHTSLIIWFYKQSISFLIDHLNTYYKLNQADPTFVLIKAIQINVLNLYLYLGFSFFMYILLRKSYMYPINKIIRNIFQNKQRKNIKLSSGERINNVFIFQSSDSKFIIASAKEGGAISDKHYHINKDKIDYIEVASNSFDK